MIYFNLGMTFDNNRPLHLTCRLIQIRLVTWNVSAEINSISKWPIEYNYVELLFPACIQAMFHAWSPGIEWNCHHINRLINYDNYKLWMDIYRMSNVPYHTYRVAYIVRLLQDSINQNFLSYILCNNRANSYPRSMFCVYCYQFCFLRPGWSAFLQ